MSGYDAGAWTDFAVAVAGSSAALSGLLFVAVSINVARIVALPALPARAGQTLIQLVIPLVASLFMLVPQSATALGLELAGVGLTAGGALLWLNRPATRSAEEPVAGWTMVRLIPALAVLVGLPVAGLTLIAGVGGGLAWITPVVMVAFVGGLANAWVLLIEILR